MFSLSRTMLVAGGLLASAAQVSAVNFSLYAYGGARSFKGFPIVYSNSSAYIYGGNISTSTEFTPVTFTPGADTGLTTFTGNPDKGSAVANPTVNNATWSDLLLYIPSDGEQIGFTSDASSDESTDVFRFFGATAMVHLDSTYATAFTAVNVTEDVWELKWNDTAGTPITLRRDPPSTQSTKKLKVKREYNIFT